MAHRPRKSPPRRGKNPPRRTGAGRGAGQAAGRRGAGWIYGRHAVLAALANPARHLHRLVLTSEAEAALPATVAAVQPRAEIAAPGEIAHLLPEGAVHQGFAALADPLPAPALEDVLAGLEAGAGATVLVLDQVTDPRNTGAILRSAAAMDAAAVIVPDRRSAPESATLAKAASGALETVALVRVTNVVRAMEALKSAGFWCIGLDARAPATLAESDLTGRIALVLGSEGGGLRRLVAQNCDLTAALPMPGMMESLNVSAAAAIALYEAARQRAG